jgi:hypothetical protein
MGKILAPCTKRPLRRPGRNRHSARAQSHAPGSRNAKTPQLPAGRIAAPNAPLPPPCARTNPTQPVPLGTEPFAPAAAAPARLHCAAHRLCAPQPGAVTKIRRPASLHQHVDQVAMRRAERQPQFAKVGAVWQHPSCVCAEEALEGRHDRGGDVARGADRASLGAGAATASAPGDVPRGAGAGVGSAFAGGSAA